MLHSCFSRDCGIASGKRGGHNGSFSVTVEGPDCSCLPLLFHSTFPREFTRNFIPCLTLEDFQSSEWRDGRRVGENWFPALTLVIVLQTLSIWIFLDVVVFNDENLRDTERDTFFNILEFTTFLSKGGLTCRSFNVRLVARVEKMKREHLFCQTL